MQTTPSENQQDTNRKDTQRRNTAFKPKAFKSLGWFFFGLSKPEFRHSVQDTNAFYIKSYN